MFGKKKSENHYCNGCETYGMITFTQSCVRFNLDDKCPCGKCIIKMMCQAGCGEYHTWINKFKGEKGEND